jgi:biotin carboxyl carrier protein
VRHQHKLNFGVREKHKVCRFHAHRRTKKMRRVVQCRSMFALARLPRLARLPASGALLKRAYHLTRAVYAQPGTPRAVPNAQGVLSYTLTDVGEGISECELLQWYVTEGQELNEFDKVCEVQSDKAIVEITSRYTGKVVKLHYKVGDMAKVGGPLIDIKVKSEVCFLFSRIRVIFLVISNFHARHMNRHTCDNVSLDYSHACFA